MSYPAPFHRIVLIGTLYQDIFNVTLSMIPVGGGTMGPATQALADNVRNAVSGWWDDPASGGAFNTGGINLISNAKLTSVKVNRISTAGLYMDPVAIESVLPTPVGGPVASLPPAQLSLVSTLRGTNERARAGKGRMFWPPTSSVQSVSSDGRITAASALAHAQGVVNLIGILNDVYLTSGSTSVAGIASKAGSGAFQAVATVSAGRVVDTMRSRRNKLQEAPESVLI
jgi:hypothetical protein